MTLAASACLSSDSPLAKLFDPSDTAGQPCCSQYNANDQWSASWLSTHRPRHVGRVLTYANAVFRQFSHIHLTRTSPMTTKFVHSLTDSMNAMSSTTFIKDRLQPMSFGRLLRNKGRKLVESSLAATENVVTVKIVD